MRRDAVHACARCRPRARWPAASASISASFTGSGRGGLITLDDVMAVGTACAARAGKMHPAAAPRAPPDDAAAMSRRCAACGARWRRA